MSAYLIRCLWAVCAAYEILEAMLKYGAEVAVIILAEVGLITLKLEG
jgi:hypothetical protein